MVKLTKSEMARQTISIREYDCDGKTIGELYEKLGPDAFIDVEYNYSDMNVTVVCNRQETDEEYNARINDLKRFKLEESERKRLRKKHDEDREVELYRKLRAKYGERE